MLLRITHIVHKSVRELAEDIEFADVAETAFINPDAVTSAEGVTLLGLPYMFIFLGVGEHRDSFRVTLEEWQRIEPLLTGEKPAYSVHADTFQEYAKEWCYKQCAAYDNATRALAAEALDALTAYVTGARIPVKTELPADVIAAWEETLRAKKSGYQSDWLTSLSNLQQVVNRIITATERDAS